MGDSPLGIFISYRRDDSADVTGRIYDHLVNAFGDGVVFKDVDAIPLGVDFRQHLSDAIVRCRVVLVVIGRRWVDARDEEGKRRLEASSDFVRIEVAAALERGVPVVPLLVQGATMPDARDLPDEIRELAFRNGTTIKSDPDFRADMQRLIRGLRGSMESTPVEVSIEPEHRAEPPPQADESRSLQIRTFGTWSYRPAGDAAAEWVGTTVPATVVVYPGEEVYRLRAGYDVQGNKQDERWPDDEQLAVLVEDLAGLESFRSLDLTGGESITDDGLTLVSELSSLVELDLTRCGQITDAGLARLGVLTRLRDLRLSYCDGITDAGLSHLGRLRSLATLDLSGCRAVTDAGLSNLRGLTALRRLNLSDCAGITDAGLVHLQRLRQLEAIELQGCELSSAGLGAFAAVPSLRVLGLGFCSRLTSDGMRRIARLGELRALDLRGSDWLDDDAMGYLAWMTSLEELHLPWCTRFTDSALKSLVPLESLARLDLRGCEQLTDDAVSHLAELVSLRRLNLIDCTGISEHAVEELSAVLTASSIDFKERVVTFTEGLDLSNVDWEEEADTVMDADAVLDDDTESHRDLVNMVKTKK